MRLEGLHAEGVSEQSPGSRSATWVKDGAVHQNPEGVSDAFGNAVGVDWLLVVRVTRRALSRRRALFGDPCGVKPPLTPVCFPSLRRRRR